MDFWNIAIPALTFLVPTVACLYFAFGPAARLESEPKWALLAFGISMLVALVGVVHFDQPVRMESLWPLAADPSGYFEFSFQLHWHRYVWIFFSNMLLFAFVAYDGRSATRGLGLKYALLSAASLSFSLAYLSENIFLSLIFIEVTVFLLYAFLFQAGEHDSEAERVAYFKRSSFIFLAVIAMLGLAATRAFSTSSVMLLGVVLYIASFVFSRHNLAAWRYLALLLLQAGTIYFLLGRSIREDMSPELWLPLSAVFAVAAVFFSTLSLLSLSSLGATFWTAFSAMGYLLFLRFSSGKPEDQFWGSFEAITLLLVFALGCLLRFARLAEQGWQKAVFFLLAALSVAVMSGALPGLDTASPKTSAELPMKLVVFAALTFLLAFTVGRALATAFGAGKEEREQAGNSFLYGLAPVLAAFLVQIGAVVRMIDLYGESPFRMGFAYLITTPHVATANAALVVGLLGGFLLGSNARFLGWIRGKEQRMETFFPAIDPTVISWNERVVQAPGRGFHWAAGKLGLGAERVASFVESGDRIVFGEKLYEGVRKYGTSVSSAVRYFHSGSIRSYLFAGILITLAASLLFLSGVR